MKFKSTVYSSTSGSIAGLTYSHNTYGMYTRGRVIPTNPNSTLQQAIRAQFAPGHIAWLALSQAVKDAWNAYAAGTPITDRLGNSIHLTGRTMFMRDYIVRKANGLGLPPITVTTMGLANLSTCTLTATAPATGSLAYGATDAWCTTTGGFLYIYCSMGKGAGTIYYRGPYRLAATVEGSTASPPASPKAFTLPYNVSAGQKVFCRCIASDAEGRLSEARFLFDTVA